MTTVAPAPSPAPVAARVELAGPQTCDRCGPSVKAKKVVRMPDGNVLTFCNNHTERYAEGLRAAGAVIEPL